MHLAIGPTLAPIVAGFRLCDQVEVSLTYNSSRPTGRGLEFFELWKLGRLHLRYIVLDRSSYRSDLIRSIDLHLTLFPGLFSLLFLLQSLI